MHRDQFIDVFNRLTLTVCALAFGAVMLAVPVREFFHNQEKSRILSPEQQTDYSALVAQPNDEAIVLAANTLFTRSDIAGIVVWRGNFDNPDFETRLKKATDAAYLHPGPGKMVGGYYVQVTYTKYPTPFNIWPLLASMKDIGASLAGLFLISFALFQWRPREHSVEEPNERKRSEVGLRSVK